MKIWIVKEAETIPSIMGNQGRLGRAGMFAEYFAERGHKVTWWLSTFRHDRKILYSDHQVDLDLDKNIHVTMLHVKRCYKKNISLARIRYSKVLAQKFRKAAEAVEVPDAIVCSWPLIDLAYECVRYGQRHGVPVVVDIRDMWPDIFVQPFKGVLKPIAKLGVDMLYGRTTGYVMRNATRVVGVIPKALDLAAKHGRAMLPGDHVLHLCHRQQALSEAEAQEAEGFWRGLGIEDTDFIVVFFGFFEERITRLDVMMEAARTNNDKNVKFVYCGDGLHWQDCKDMSKDWSNIVLPGYINAAKINWISHRAKLGLLPYRNTDDFKDALPNKFGEYLAFGLPILTSLDGASRTIVSDRKCGAWFDSADDLNKAVASYSGDEGKCRREKENAMKLYHEQFDARRIYMGFVHEVEDMVKQGAAAGARRKQRKSFQKLSAI